MLSWLKDFFSGFLVGVANIIPGVSGGTLLLVLGMYRRVIAALSGFRASSIHELLVQCWGVLFSSNRMDILKRLGDTARKMDLFFLARVSAGALVAIMVLSGLMKILLEKQLSNTYAFFFGLIVVSTLISFKMLKQRKLIHVGLFLLGMGLTVGISASVNPALSAINKSEHYKKINESRSVEASAHTTTSDSQRLKYVGRYSPRELAMSATSGAISVSAMILPGVSGSLVLILMGQYYEVISAVSGVRTLQLDYIVFLSFFASGMLLGLLLFAKLVNFVFRRFYNGTMALLIGLMAGSLYALWPFKQTMIMDQYVRTAEGISFVKDAVVHTNINIMPQNLWVLATALFLCLSGAVLMQVLAKFDTEVKP